MSVLSPFRFIEHRTAPNVRMAVFLDFSTIALILSPYNNMSQGSNVQGWNPWEISHVYECDQPSFPMLRIAPHVYPQYDGHRYRIVCEELFLAFNSFIQINLRRTSKK
jgi:hypothetical protein